MFCTKCGTQNPDDAAFCGSCGAPIAPRNQAPVPATAQSPTPAYAGYGQQSTGVSAAAAKTGNKIKIIVIAVVAVIVVALAIFGITQCAFGGGLRPGVYTGTIGSSSQSIKVGDDKTISYTYSGMNIVFSYDKAGTQGDSIIYDARIKSINGNEVKTNPDGTISNLQEIIGNLPDEYGNIGLYSLGTMKLSMQFMAPKGGTDGNIVGDWGLRCYMSATTPDSLGDSTSNATYFCTLMKVDKNGQCQVYSVDDNSGVAPNSSLQEATPGMTAEDILSYGGKLEVTLNWTKISDTQFSFNIPSSSSSEPLIITLPSK